MCFQRLKQSLDCKKDLCPAQSQILIQIINKSQLTFTFDLDVKNKSKLDPERN